MAINKEGYWEDDPPTSYDLLSNLGQSFFTPGDATGYSVSHAQFISIVTRAGVTAEDAALLWTAINEDDHPNDAEYWGFARGVLAVFGLLKKR